METCSKRLLCFDPAWLRETCGLFAGSDKTATVGFFLSKGIIYVKVENHCQSLYTAGARFAP